MKVFYTHFFVLFFMSISSFGQNEEKVSVFLDTTMTFSPLHIMGIAKPFSDYNSIAVQISDS